MTKNSAHFTYPVALVVDESDGGYVVMFRDLPEAITQGDSVEECLQEAVDCLEEAIAGRIDDNREIPEPSQKREGEYVVNLPLEMVFKALVYLAVKEAKISQSQLVKQLKIDKNEIRRILNPRHETKLSTLEQVLSVLNKKIEVVVDSQ